METQEESKSDVQEQGPKKGIVIIVITILLGTNGLLLWQFFEKKSSLEIANQTIIATTNYLLRGRGYDPNIALDQPAPGGGFGAFASDHFIALEQRVGARIFSRLREMTHFKELTGDDMRRKLP